MPNLKRIFGLAIGLEGLIGCNSLESKVNEAKVYSKEEILRRENIGIQILWREAELCKRFKDFDLESAIATLDSIRNCARHRLEGLEKPEEILTGIYDTIINHHQFEIVENQTLFYDALMSKRIDCDTLSYAFLSVGEDLGLPLRAVLLPNHIFVRWNDGRNRVNFEITIGRVNDETYYLNFERYHVSSDSIKKGVWLRELTREELIGHVIGTAGIMLYNNNFYEESIMAYDASLCRLPNNPVMYNNRGLAFTEMGKGLKEKGKFQEANEKFREAYLSLTTAIELTPDYITAYSNRNNVLSNFKVNNEDAKLRAKTY